MEVSGYVYQRNFLFQNTDQFLSAQVQYNIGGRDPRICKRVDRYACLVPGDIDVRDAIDPFETATTIPDLTSAGTTFLKKPLPYYLARDGAFGYSIPALKPLDVNSAGSNMNPAFDIQILIDNEALFPAWNFGQSDSNNLCHYLAHGIGIYRPDFEVGFVPSRRLMVDKRQLPRGVLATTTGIPAVARLAQYVQPYEATARATAVADANAIVNTAPFMISNWGAIQQMPSRFVITVPIRDEAANGTIFTVITTGYNATTLKTTTPYHPMGYRAVDFVALSSLTAASLLYNIRSCWEQPVSVLSTWAFKQTSYLTFGPSTASIRELLPTGAVVGGSI